MKKLTPQLNKHLRGLGFGVAVAFIPLTVRLHLSFSSIALGCGVTCEEHRILGTEL